MAGNKNDKYELVEAVGKGGLGKVFRARERASGKQVALKVMHQSTANQAHLVGIFQKEMMLLNSFEHPNWVRLVDFSAEAPYYYLATEFVEGVSLKELLSRCGKIPPLVACAIAIQIAQALDYLHLRDFIHADLSLSNILVRNDGRVLVTDLGLVSDSQSESYKEESVGTAGYYSPEHVSLQPVVAQSDIYSLGLVWFELITGNKAILLARASDSAEQILKSMKRLKVKNLPIEEAMLKRMCEQLARALLDWKQSSRLANAEEAVHAFEHILTSFNIYGVEACVEQFLGHLGQVAKVSERPWQNIYLGFDFSN